MNKIEYLEKYIFFGLKNINDGFDAQTIKYFSQNDFAIVLSRVENYGLGITGIEPWVNDEFYGVAIYEDYDTESTDPQWYNTAFQRYTKAGEELQYSATYYVPKKLLE